jgi:hypothetical protein
MEDYDVVDIDDNKVGHVAGTHDGYLIVESGTLREKKHAVPVDTTRVDEDEQVIRLTISKEMVQEGPTLDDEGPDWQLIKDYYGRSSELEGQKAGLASSDEGRAQMRESLRQPDTDVGPRMGAVGIHQDEWRSKE